jgi:hypothetical protein
MALGKDEGPGAGGQQVGSKRRLRRSIEQQHHQSPQRHSNDHSSYGEYQGFGCYVVIFNSFDLHLKTIP